jgi:2'-5' RNA ligase
VQDQAGALLRCVEAVETDLEAVGFERERRRFSAHITLGRLREDRSAGSLRGAVEATNLEAIDQDVTSLVLMSSILSPKGPTYSIVSRAMLSKDA